MSAAEVQALWLSLQVAFVTTLLSTPVSVMLAMLMARTHWRGKLALDTLILLPMAMPPVVIGFVLLLGLDQGGALGHWMHEATGWRPAFFPTGAIVAASLLTVPLMVRTLRPAFEATDPMLLPVARTLGASRWQAWWTITLPLAWPAVASAVALGLAAAWGECGATLVLAATLKPQIIASSAAPAALAHAFQTAGNHEAAWRLALVALSVALLAVMLSELGRRRWLARWQARLRTQGMQAR